MQQIKDNSIALLVNCLDDWEMNRLGNPFPEYSRAAKTLALEITRIPMQEGSTPSDFQTMSTLLDQVEQVTSQGKGVLCHCRAGTLP